MKTAEELLELALPSVLEGLKQELKNTIDWQIKEKAAKIVCDHVTDYIKQEVLPEITGQLVESREGLISLGASLGPKVVEALTESLLAELKEKLEKSWERSKIFESMFK